MNKKKIEQSATSLVRVRDEKERNETGYMKKTEAQPLDISTGQQVLNQVHFAGVH